MINRPCIGIIGCGNMGFALAQRLTQFGFTVVMGSRRLQERINAHYTITSIVECIRQSSILFIAIQAEHYTNALIAFAEQEPSLFDGKILIDISNRTNTKSKQKTDDLSNAERLQTALPNAFVVKAFNTISSFVMASMTAGESRSVFVASDHSHARDQIMILAREMNFDSHNAGSLRAARQLEVYSQSLCPKWQLPIIIALIVLSIWLTYTLYMNFVNKRTTSWNQLFLHMTNKVLCSSAITMLAIVYMPSNIACIFQLIYGNRERRFPIWLDQWLLSRKQLGLLTFAIGLFHATITLVLMSPAYYSTWFHNATAVLPVGHETQIVVKGGYMTAKGELASLLGILTLLVMSLLALASIPAIGNLLNWREWHFIQSKLGTVVLLLAIGHVFAMAMPRWIDRGFVKSLYSVGFLCVFIPVVTILLKFILWLPCFDRPIQRIRRGTLDNVVPIKMT